MLFVRTMYKPYLSINFIYLNIFFYISGVGRTPPGASNGVGRGGPSTRGRSTGTTSYQVRI